MFRGGEGASRGPGLDRIGGLVLAMIAGLLVPVMVVLAVAARNPVPRACGTGQATSTTVEGALVYTTGSDLWYSEGLPGHPRKLVDYAPPRARPGAAASPSAGAPVAVPSAVASANPSPTPAAPVARVLAADVSSDRKVVAFLVLDPPDRPGSMSLKLLSPADAPGTLPVTPWYDERPDRNNLGAVRLQVLDSGKVLFFEPEPAPVTVNAPAAAAPAPTPGPSASPTPRPSPSPAATVDGSVSVQAVIVAPAPTPAIVDHGSQQFLFSQGLAAWPDARGFRVPTVQPAVSARVDGPGAKVAGIAGLDLNTPIAARHLRELVLGSIGHTDTQPVCTLASSIVPQTFSPDESELALRQGDQTLLLDLVGSRSAVPLFTGRLLAWRS